MSVYPKRPNVDRGNTYPPPTFLTGRQWERFGIFPNWDCKPSGGQVEGSSATPAGQPVILRGIDHEIGGRLSGPGQLRSDAGVIGPQ